MTAYLIEIKMLLSLLTGLLIILVVFYNILTKLSTKSNRLTVPAGPRGWPIIGNVLEFMKNPHQVMSTWARTHGDIYTIKLFNETVISVNSGALIREALIEKAGCFDGRPLRFRCEFALLGSSNITFREFGPEFTKLKRFTMRAFRDHFRKNKTPDGKYSEIIRELLAMFASFGGQPHDARMDIYTFVCNNVCLMLLGEKLPNGHPHLEKVKEFDSLICQNLTSGRGTELDVFPLLRYLPNATYGLLAKAKKSYTEFFGHYLPNLKSTRRAGEVRCVADALFASVNEDGTAAFDDNTVLAECAEIVIAGSSSSATAIYCLLNYAMCYPEIQSKIQQEIDHVIGQERVPSKDDRSAMPYLEATIMETLRFISHLPFGIPHKALQLATLGGYSVPKNTQVLFNFWHVHHDERIWGDPWAFRPDRFIDSSTGGLVAADSPQRKNFMPFSLGKRVCIGESAAKSMIFLASASVLQKFTMIPCDDKAPPKPLDPRDFTLGIILEPTLYELKAIPR